MWDQDLHEMQEVRWSLRHPYFLATPPEVCFAYNLCVFAAILLMLLTAGCVADNKAAPAAQQATAAPVFIAKALRQSVPIEIQAVGQVEAYSTVTIKAQVGGELTVVDFKEGATVHKGDRLFVIDPRPYQAAVTQAEAVLDRDKAELQAAQANLARDMAQEDYARTQAKRYSDLSVQGVIPKETSDQTDTQAKTASQAVLADRAAISSSQANLASDQAALERARLSLEYCTIRSPIDGRTGRLLVKQGNVVKANDMDLVTINQLQPIYVSFAVPEASLSPIRAQLKNGRVPVAASLQDNSGVAETGTLTFIDNSVDSSTGTIALKATFSNADGGLWPGQFARAVVRLNASADSIVIPTPAVQTGQEGKFVFVVKADSTVEARPVTAGRTVDRDVVIEKGLAEGETVVTSGQLRLIQGSRIQIKPSP